ncbi:MAG: efflux RND transporter periplasmic adaptor subunit [Bacteroidales bacterium]|nr:efflux RND transporter periplasmic adaptor subunit [Bacteroidales bacterium]MDD4362000.1 efflux RND transporter periplasmic adaptor subunit [Bacteroidales bacterium]MDD4430477.1 efflux RND transporter periplasmic adaptor subunit [Bacteroidales bacterium]
MKSKHLPILLFGLSVGLFLLSGCKETVQDNNLIKRGDFRQTITETGELLTLDNRAIVMPRYGRYWYNMKIIGLVEHGAKVQAGDSLVQFDPTEVKKFIMDRQTQLENEQANLEKMLVQQQNNLNNLQSTLRSEQASFNLRKLTMEYTKFESDRVQEIKRLQFRQAEINFEKVKRRIELTKVMSANDLKIQKIRVAQVEKEIQMAQEVLPQLTLRAPISGIFQVARKRRSRDNLAVGDDVRFGNMVGSVPDLTWMKVETTVNEVDRAKISLGQEVVVRLDALPEIEFKAEVSFISVLCRHYDNNDPRKVFDVEVKLLESDERLKPGMTVSCEFIASDLYEVLYVPNSCLLKEGGRYWVFIPKATGYDKLAVDFHTRNNTHSVISGNIAEGQEVIPVARIMDQE